MVKVLRHMCCGGATAHTCCTGKRSPAACQNGISWAQNTHKPYFQINGRKETCNQRLPTYGTGNPMARQVDVPRRHSHLQHRALKCKGLEHHVVARHLEGEMVCCSCYASLLVFVQILHQPSQVFGNAGSGTARRNHASALGETSLTHQCWLSANQELKWYKTNQQLKSTNEARKCESTTILNQQLKSTNQQPPQIRT